MSSRRRNSGHTLLELMVVMVILAVIAGIVIPSASVGSERKLDTLQLAIQDAIDHCQALAYHQGACYGVRFDVDGEYFACVNENGVPVEDPFSHGDYIVRLQSPRPDMPSDVHVVYAMFGTRPLAAFDEKGILIESGEIHLRAGDTQRWLVIDTATSRLMEIPVSP